jgi:outer membrane cobalamin receptor
MQQKLFSAICLVILLSSSAIAEDQDSAKTYQAKDVVITATRSDIQLKDSPSPVQIITTQDIIRTNGSSIIDVLRSSESVYIKDQGPTTALKTISFRGMASEHILVLLNGNRINNFQNGLVDFSLLPMNNVDRIEVVRGGNSSLYGADALGGIINIISSRPTEAFKIHSDASIGSLDYRRYSLDTRGRIQGVGLVLGVMHDQATGNYPFILHRVGMPDTTNKRNGADFTRTQLYLNTDYSFDEKSILMFSLQRVKSNQGTPGSLKFQSNMRQDDDAISTSVSVRGSHFDGFIFQMNFGFNYDLQKYYSQTKSTTVTVNPQLQWMANSWDRLLVGGEFVEGNLQGMFPNSTINRVQRSLYISNEMIFSRESSILDRLSLYQSLRYDELSEGENAISPKIGFNLRILQNWETRIRASYGRNFRMPTFNDLYDSWLGNPTLKPENSTCFDVGIETAIDKNSMHMLSLTYFDIATENRILLNPFYYPVNVAKVQSTGAEFRYDFRLPNDAVKAFADITFNDAVRQSNDSTDGKQLMNIPTSVSTAGISANVFGFNINLTQSYTSKRYTNEIESTSLPAYSLTDVNISTTFELQSIKFVIRAEVSNLFDTDYQVLEYYPMPGRTFRATFGIDY